MTRCADMETRRLGFGISRRELAAKLRITERTLARWEKGNTKPSWVNWNAWDQMLSGLIRGRLRRAK